MSNPKATKNKIGTSVSGKLMTINYVSILSGVALNFKGIVDVDHWKYIYTYIYIYGIPGQIKATSLQTEGGKTGGRVAGGNLKNIR